MILWWKLTFGPCFEGTRGVDYTERGSIGHFRLEQGGCPNTQMLTRPIYEEQFVRAKCFPFGVAKHERT